MSESGGMNLQEMAQYYYERQLEYGQSHDNAVRITRDFLHAIKEPPVNIDAAIARIERKPERRRCAGCGDPWDGEWAIHTDAAGRDWCDACWKE